MGPGLCAVLYTPILSSSSAHPQLILSSCTAKTGTCRYLALVEFGHCCAYGIAMPSMLPASRAVDISLHVDCISCMQALDAANGTLRGTIPASTRVMLSQKLPTETSARLAPFLLSQHAAGTNQSKSASRIIAAPVLYATTCDGTVDDMYLGVLTLALDPATGALRGTAKLVVGGEDDQPAAEVTPAAGGELRSSAAAACN
jgi:hypothetical protein